MKQAQSVGLWGGPDSNASRINMGPNPRQPVFSNTVPSKPASGTFKVKNFSVKHFQMTSTQHARKLQNSAGPCGKQAIKGRYVLCSCIFWANVLLVMDYAL